MTGFELKPHPTIPRAEVICTCGSKLGPHGHQQRSFKKPLACIHATNSTSWDTVQLLTPGAVLSHCCQFGSGVMDQ
jgi:hypothetical protein